MIQDERRQRPQRQAPTPRKFWMHLAIFLVVNAGVITLNLVRTPDRYWFQWVLLGWGAGLLLNAYQVFGCCWTKGCRVNSAIEPAPRDTRK
jgi:hypothetical protein